MAQHNDFGKDGELAAQRYLVSKGYGILETNWVSGKNELDIICVKDGVLVVVEVKSRSTENFEYPQDAVTNGKIRRIVEATNDYVQQKEWDAETRFDVVAALPEKGGGFKIEHIEDAFLPPVIIAKTKCTQI